MGIRTVRASFQSGDLPRLTDRDEARLLAVLEDNCAEAVTISELRERGIRAPGQAIYTLQLTGYQIDRVRVQRPNGHNSTGYRLGLRASRSSDLHEVIDDAL